MAHVILQNPFVLVICGWSSGSLAGFLSVFMSLVNAFLGRVLEAAFDKTDFELLNCSHCF